VEDAQAIGRDGFDSVWIPRIPGYRYAMTALVVIGQGTGRIEPGTAVVAIQTRQTSRTSRSGCTAPSTSPTPRRCPSSCRRWLR
jgi:alkanesulfonate monooxygenase SsuD/methylene tetrahydromethanopterin reductase-like flavin-dependent oxidoreductase (luciferase family)